MRNMDLPSGPATLHNLVPWTEHSGMKILTKRYAIIKRNHLILKENAASWHYLAEDPSAAGNSNKPKSISDKCPVSEAPPKSF